jgi:acetoin utilization deacetylase AcuC-like enzyme
MITIAYSDRFLYKLPAGHRFPISKYELVKEQLLYEGIITRNQLVDPGMIDKEVQLAHSPLYYNKIKTFNLTKNELRRLGIPLHEQSLGRALNSVAGTLKSAEWAFQKGLGINIGGGYHHAHYDHGEGFCIFNDLAITARYLKSNHLAENVLIIDLDVHQGNGTASILRNDKNIFTFSMHGANNFPMKKEISNLDVAVSDYTGDQEYLDILDFSLNRIQTEFSFDFILYQAGVDVLGKDLLGKLRLSMDGCRERDTMIFRFSKKKNIPLVITLGGGYSRRISDIINAHTNTIRSAIDTLG